MQDNRGRGSIQLSQFVHALEEIPTELAWRDLRQRLLAKKGTMQDALRSLDADPDSSESDLGRCVAKCEVPELQLADVSRTALRSFLRAAAPAISLQDFWRRVATEWPEVMEAAKTVATRKEAQEAQEALQHLEELVSELLPCELQVYTSVPDLEKGGVSASKAVVLPSLSFEMFDALAEHVDVPRDNARELFQCLSSAASESEKEGKEDAALASSIFLEDFAEQLTLWAETFEPKGSKRVRAAERVRQVVAPVRRAISALKAELQPELLSQGSVAEKSEEAREPRDPRRSKARRISKLPWCAYYRCRRA